MGEVAKGVKKLLEGKGASAIAIGQFSGPANFPTSAGPGIALALTEELRELGVAVKPRAGLGISGSYRVQGAKKPAAAKDGRPPEPLVLLLKAQVEDDAGEVLVDFERKIFDARTISQLLALSYQGKPGGGKYEYEQDLEKKTRESLLKPSIYVANSRIAADASSPYAIEVLVKKGGQGSYRPLSARNEDGLAYVSVEKDDVYAVRLINNSAYEAAVALTIDGLSAFAFSEDKSLRGYYIVPPRGGMTVVGWHGNSRESYEFQITDYGKGAAALLGSNLANVGTITATFAAAWTKQQPPDEPKEPLTVGAAPPFATDKGKKVGVATAVVKREIGVPRASVSVRYSR
ncbi:MAG: hypothetical protein L0Z62_01430 [Gemmataceae bacterium]|nr:hypothetical protein [Gemmataceae bacterium]